MLNFAFFIAGFLSICWTTYSLRLINLSAVWEKENIDILYSTAITVCLPIITIWGILWCTKSLFREKSIIEQIQYAITQLKKSNEANAVLGHALMDISIEIKNNSILQKFDLFIANINETLSDIIKRSNSISSAQMEHLWNRTSGGEQWLLAKTLIETNEFQPDFTNYLIQKGRKDTLLKSSIIEFCARYMELCHMLDTFDKQRLFYNMIEKGALGQAFQIILPISEKIQRAEPVEKMPEKKIKEFSLTEEPISFPSFLSDEEYNKKEPQLRAATNKSNTTDIDAGLKIIRDELLASKKETPMTAPTITNFNDTQTALRNLKQTPSISLPDNNETEQHIISLDELEREINSSKDNNYDEYAYPFGEK